LPLALPFVFAITYVQLLRIFYSKTLAPEVLHMRINTVFSDTGFSKWAFQHFVLTTAVYTPAIHNPLLLQGNPDLAP
jgi:hypothetical protein